MGSKGFLFKTRFTVARNIVLHVFVCYAMKTNITLRSWMPICCAKPE